MQCSQLYLVAALTVFYHCVLTDTQDVEENVENIGQDEDAEEGRGSSSDRIATWNGYPVENNEENSRKKCQKSTDCKSHQVCYLPTNECKDQLSFSLSSRSTCATREDCRINEVCYLPTQRCVCDINSTELAGDCIAFQHLENRVADDNKFVDTYGWEIIPYWGVWANYPTLGRIFLGNYTKGTGVGDNLMYFGGGDSQYCGFARSAELQYLCYCEEYTCAPSLPSNTLKFFIGEFVTCIYSIFVFTPLACQHLIP